MVYNPAVVAVGDKIAAGTINQIGQELSLGTSYTPTINNWSSAGAPPTTTGRYWITGNYCQVAIMSTLGTGTISVGNISFTLPVTADTTGLVLDIYQMDGTAGMTDVSVPQQYTGPIRLADANTARILRTNTTTGNGAVNPVTSSLPFTWAAGDQISMAFSYPIA